MMQIARWALGALVAALLPLTALAQGPGGAAAQAVVAGVQFPCQTNQQIPLSMNFNSTGQNCKDGQTVSSYSALPGFTLASGSLSGTGATSATSYDATGKVIDFTLPTTRITNAGILVEAAATNLILDSQVMGSAPWAAFESTATDNNAVAPDGTTTAMTLVATGSFPTITSGTVTISGVQTITTSVFAQPGASSGNNQFLLKAADPNDGTFSNVDAVITIIPAAGGVPGSCSAAIDSTFHYINVSATATWLPAYGYCRASLTFTTISSTTAMIQQDWVGSGATSCTGSCIGSSVNFWGAQMEIGGLTSYLPTTSAGVTRSTDTLTQTFSPGAAQYATVYFAPNQSYSYPAIPSSPLNLVSLAVTGGQPISEVLVSYTEPIPGAAIGAGYQQLTFQTPSWNGSNVDFSATCAPGHSWYFYNYGGTVPTTANTTVAGGVISVGASGNNYNSTIATVCGLGGTAFRGTAFGGGGYFEATLKWQNGAFDFTKGWPAWWMGSVEAQTLSVGTLWPGAIQTSSPGFKHFPEIDIMEYFGGDFSEPLNCATQTIIDWSGPNFSSLVLNAKDSFYCPDSTGATFASYHKYGLLWIPATASSQGSATYYFDHLPVFQQAWTLLTAADQPPAAGNPWLFGVTDQNPAVGPNHFMLELGSGATYTSGSGNTTPIVVNDVKVWQLNINDNLYNGASPPPAPVPSACPGAVAYPDDGCLAADQTAGFKFASLAALSSYAVQNGQQDQTLSKPWGQDVPALTYPTGNTPYSGGAYNLPSGALPTPCVTHCVYSATGGLNAGPKLNIQNVTTSAAGLVPSFFVPPSPKHPAGQTFINAMVFDHYDFGAGGVCTQVEVHNSSAVPLVFVSPHIKTWGNCVGHLGIDFQIDSGVPANIAIINPEIDGNYPAFSVASTSGVQSMGGEFADLRSGPYDTTILYGHFHDCRTRCLTAIGGEGVVEVAYSDRENSGLQQQAFNVTGNISSGGVYTVTGLLGTVTTGGSVQDSGIISGFSTYITVQLSGTAGGVGTYQLSNTTTPCSNGTSTCTLDGSSSSIVGLTHDDFLQVSLPIGSSGSPTVQTTQSQSYNLIISRNTDPANPNTGDAMIYQQINTSTNNFNTITNCLTKGNIIYTNANGGHFTYSAGISYAYNTCTNTEISNNWINPNGVLQCIQSNVSDPMRFTNTPVISANRSLYDGSSIDQFNDPSGHCAGHN